MSTGINSASQKRGDSVQTLPEDLSQGVELYDKLLEGKVTVKQVDTTGAVSSISNKLEETKASLKRHPTAALWLQYMEQTDILQRFIKAERTGNWELHLRSVQEMMPFLAAAGHNLYTKSLHVYLQKMLQLKTSHHQVHTRFEEGHHVLRRTERFWAGLSSDLIIEQMLMRSLKTTGGLTRGRGMTESQRSTWLLGMPACANVNSAMQDFAGSTYTSSEQHKDMTDTRLKRDEKDTRLIACFLEERDPFRECSRLKNIATGVVADSSANAHKACDVGTVILDKMVGHKVSEFSFKWPDKAVTMATVSKSSVKIDGDIISVDPQLLFQRLVSVVGDIYQNKREVFKFELSSYPSSLFETPFFPRLPNKAQLAEEIWVSAKDGMPEVPTSGELQYVLDGGALLQLIPWSRGASFASIVQSYVCYVTQKYKHAVVVFDGYLSGPSTKDVTHSRRAKGQNSTEVLFTPDMTLQTKKELFLTNTKNKQRLIAYLSEALSRNSTTVVCAEGDADALIVAQALESSKTKVTVVLGDDTDLLVLLCHYACENNHDIFLQPSHRSSAKSAKWWNIRHTRASLGMICQTLPVIHAVSGCDTTSRLFGIGKRRVLRKFQKSEKAEKSSHTVPFQECCK